MILSELWSPLLFGVGLFSLLVVSTVVLQDALKFIQKYDLPPAMFFTLVGYAVPQFVILAIPMGVLLGTLLSVGRLNSDNEIIALRACGISLMRILTPFVIVGLLLSCVTFLGNELIVPYCNTQLKNIESAVITGSDGLGSRQRITWSFYNPDSGQLQWVLVAGEIEGNELSDVSLYYYDDQDKYKNFMIEADRARWDDKAWTLYHMRQVMLHRREGETEQLITEAEEFEVLGFNISPDSMKRRMLASVDLTIRQLAQIIQDKMNKEEGFTWADKEILNFATALHFKWSIPLTPLFFVLIAVPMAIMPQRSSRAMGMGLALVTILVYYSMFIICQKAGSAGVLAPAVAAWVPNGILLIVGIVLMRMREHN